MQMSNTARLEVYRTQVCYSYVRTQTESGTKALTPGSAAGGEEKERFCNMTHV